MNRNGKYKGNLISLLMMLSAGQLFYGQTEIVSSSIQKMRTEEVTPIVKADSAKGSRLVERDAAGTKETCGTRLIFTNGDEILCTIEEIGPLQISYLPCDNLSGPLRKTAKDRVFMIYYLNGTKEVVTKLETKEEKKPAAVEKKNGETFVPEIPNGIYPKNIDLIITKKGQQIHCYIDRVSNKKLSYHIFRRGKDPDYVIPLEEVSNYVQRYKLTVLN